MYTKAANQISNSLMALLRRREKSDDRRENAEVIPQVETCHTIIFPFFISSFFPLSSNRLNQSQIDRDQIPECEMWKSQRWKRVEMFQLASTKPNGRFENRKVSFDIRHAISSPLYSDMGQ